MRQRWRRSAHAVLLLAAAVAVSALSAVVPAPAVAAADGHARRAPAPGEARTYRPPTAAAVADPYREPPSPYAAGNRGIEYATGPGEPVGAIGPGVVRFAGQVGGRLVVTVAHPDGLRSSYVGLGRTTVGVDEVVHGGTVLGTTGGPLHLGVRRGTTYLDPASLWGRAVVGGRAVLVPDGSGPDPPGADRVRTRTAPWRPRRPWWR